MIELLDAIRSIVNHREDSSRHALENFATPLISRRDTTTTTTVVPCPKDARVVGLHFRQRDVGAEIAQTFRGRASQFDRHDGIINAVKQTDGRTRT